MDFEAKESEYLVDVLKERAKELNCLYQVEELLSNRRLSIAELFEGIIRIIPSGWQFPDACQARIVYENRNYQSPGFFSTPWTESANIRLDDRIVGKLEVCYTKEVPRSEEGIFLEKELKLIKTIADRIGQTILHRNMEQILKEWELAKNELSKTKDTHDEWIVIIDLLRRTDHGMLMHICRKMINYLFWSGIKEAIGILQNIGVKNLESFESGEINFPSVRQPLEDVITISEKTFKIASEHLSGKEITVRLKKWIQEEKYNFLVKAVDRIGASLSEIIEAISRYKGIFNNLDMSYSPVERWLKVALIHRFLSDDLRFIGVAKQYIEVQDFSNIADRIIYPFRSKGKLGGKSTGLFLAQQVLAKMSEHIPMLDMVKFPKTWYITTDELTEFLHYNGLEELKEQKYKELYEIRIDYANIIQLMKNSNFPPEIVKGLSLALDDFGESPLIVRSSSLLEDRVGAAFSGKYKSLFLSNQGSKQERLAALINAIIEVYASIFSPDSIQYRSERGLLDFSEEMGIMIQEVIGKKAGHYHFPLFAGVAFSNNDFCWSPRIKREDGLIRIVPGLGTRAVDRLSDDFPIMISPGQPKLQINTTPEEAKYYSPKKIDVINLKDNTFDTIEISSLLSEYGDMMANMHHVVSVFHENHLTKPSMYSVDYEKDDLVVTFDGLISDTPTIKLIDLILKTLKDKLGMPVDIEFASDGDDFYLLQCRSQSYGGNDQVCPIPKDIPDKDILFSADRYITNGWIQGVSYIVFVDPGGYDNLYKLDDLLNVGKIVGLLNSLLPRKQFILMGPGRWGSRGDIRLGVPVTYADINNTAVLIEIARKKAKYVPELSFGTHFFQDMVEAGIKYLPLYPDEEGACFNEVFLTKTQNILGKVLPDYEKYSDVVRVIDVPGSMEGKVLEISMNADLGEAVGFFTSPSSVMKAKPKDPEEYGEPKINEEFWRWRYYMAKRIASRIDPERFGVKAFYVFGSTNNTTAGPGSDIDLLIHFHGDAEQRKRLEQWLEGWSLCLAEMNYLKSGYASSGLLDVHIVTDEDILKKTSFAIKIGAVTDPAHQLEMNQAK